MRVLIVNISDRLGGASRAAERLHKSLLAAGVESRMLVAKKSSGDFTVVGPTSKKERILNSLSAYLDRLPLKFYKKRTKTLFSPSWTGFGNIIDKINDINPDIVHFHWICEGMIKIEDLKKIEQSIVWSLHDMWAFTGGCHYDEGCGGYENVCGNCKVLGSTTDNDLSRRVFRRKEKQFLQKKDITIVGLSRWITDCSKRSTLFKSKRHVNLPNPIDTALFKPFDKEKSRELWGLPQNKRLVLFGAMNATSDPRKGFKELSEALYKIENSDIEVVVFGNSEPQEPEDFGLKAHYVGELHDNQSLVTLYSAADVMVVPSRQENLSNAIMESLACGTPVVAFDVGGNSDMVEHKLNGYLAKPFDASDLKTGIEWVLGHKGYDELSSNAREKVLREFESSLVAGKYMELYREILDVK